MNDSTDPTPAPEHSLPIPEDRDLWIVTDADVHARTTTDPDTGDTSGVVILHVDTRKNRGDKRRLVALAMPADHVGNLAAHLTRAAQTAVLAASPEIVDAAAGLEDAARPDEAIAEP